MKDILKRKEANQIIGKFKLVMNKILIIIISEIQTNLIIMNK